MRTKLLGLLAVGLLSAPSAFAAWVGQVPGCGGCIATTAEFFITNDTGAGPFDSPPVTGLPAGWTSTRVNPNYAVATGPSASLSAWFEHYLGNIASSLEIDIFFWDGAPLTSNIYFAADYTWTNGQWSLVCQNFGAGCSGQTDPTGVGYDRSSVPEPGTLALLGLGLAGLAATRRRKQ